VCDAQEPIRFVSAHTKLHLFNK